MLDPARHRVAAAARRLAGERLVRGTAGNVSERAGELVAVTPAGAVLAQLTAEEVVIVDLHGAPVDGEGTATSELALHLGVYRRYRAGAVVHAHSPFGTALGCVLDELPLVHYLLHQLGGPIRVAPYATAGTSDLAELTVAALQDRTAALMANHGTIAIGPDPPAAVENALLLEWVSELYWRAAAMGRPRTLTEDPAAKSARAG